MTKVIYPKLVKMTTNLLDFDKNSDVNFMTQKTIIKAFKIALSLKKKKKKKKSNILIFHHFNTMFLFPFKTLCIAYQDLILYIYISVFIFCNAKSNIFAI